MVDLTEIAAIATSAFGRQVDAGETSAEQMASWLPEDRLRDGMRRMIAHYDHYGLPGGYPRKPRLPVTDDRLTRSLALVESMKLGPVERW